MILRIKDLMVERNDKTLLRDVRLTLKPGELMGVIGLNGAGKTTLFKAILGMEKYKGNIRIDEESVDSLSIKEKGRIFSYIPQDIKYLPGMTVEQFVLTGITPYLSTFESPAEIHYSMAKKALESVDMQDYGDRYIESLSGGEKQMVLLAKTILQRTQLMLLDEPCSQLDYAASHRYLRRVRAFVKERNMSAMITIHDPNLAMSFADKIIIIHDNTISTRINLMKENYIEEYLDGLNKIYNNEMKLGWCEERPIFTIINGGA